MKTADDLSYLFQILQYNSKRLSSTARSSILTVNTFNSENGSIPHNDVADMTFQNKAVKHLNITFAQAR